MRVFPLHIKEKCNLSVTCLSDLQGTLPFFFSLCCQFFRLGVWVEFLILTLLVTIPLQTITSVNTGQILAVYVSFCNNANIGLH